MEPQKKKEDTRTHPPAKKKKKEDTRTHPPAKKKKKKEDTRTHPPAKKKKKKEDTRTHPPAKKKKKKEDTRTHPPAKKKKKKEDTRTHPPAKKKKKKNNNNDNLPLNIDIPVVDFSVYEQEKTNVSDEKFEKLSEELRKAFMEVGFVYLKNTGIHQEEVDKVMDISRQFFCLSDDMKKPFSRGSFSCNVNHGWVSLETESLNPQRPGDLKEAFNITSLSTDINWPSEGVEGFRDILVSFFDRCKDLALRVLRVIAIGLRQEPKVFLEAHKHIGSDMNDTTLRTLYYPPLKSEHVVPDQLRCGEHSDYGSFTLVFQSPEGGLQVLSRTGEYISVPAIPDTVIINIADLMQRWTSYVYVSAVHRVLLPAVGDSRTRQSLAFFVHPDNEAIISCFDGSDKYPPVKAIDYLLSRFKDSYGKKADN